MDGQTGPRSTWKKMGVLGVCFGMINLMWFLMGGWTRVPVEKAVIAAPVNPLYQAACPAGDAGVPSWLCTALTQITNNDNALRSGVNAVTTTQAPTLAPKTGYISTGAIKFDNAGIALGTNTAGLAAEAVTIMLQSTDGGIIRHGLSGNTMQLRTTLAEMAYNIGSVDAGQVFNMNLNDYPLKASPVGRVVDAGVDVGVSSIFAQYTNFAPAANFDRLAGRPHALCTVTGTFGVSEVLRCEQRTTFSDTTTRSTDAGVGDWTWTATVVNSDKEVMTFRKEGTYVTDFDIRCHIDAGTTDVAIACEFHGEQQ